MKTKQTMNDLFSEDTQNGIMPSTYVKAVTLSILKIIVISLTV
jgi:hypothetical protein